MTNNEIARRMGISEHTVRLNLTNAFAKLRDAGVLKDEHAPRCRVNYLLGLADGITFAGQDPAHIMKAGETDG